MNSRIFKGFVWQQKGAVATARIRNNAGVYITQASLTSVTRNVYDLDNAGALVLGPTTLTISSVVFDALQNQGADLVLWTANGEQIDNVGWNFKDAIPATAFPLGRNGLILQRRYRLEYVFDPTSGDDFALVYEAPARNLYSTAD